MKPNIQIHKGELISPIRSLKDYFHEGGVSIVEAAFAHTYFVHPDEVRKKTPLFPERVRQSREYFPGAWSKNSYYLECRGRSSNNLRQ